MEKKSTFIHFLCAIALIYFAIVLFCVANGSISMERPRLPDGSFDASGLIKVLIPFNLCILCFGGLITVLNEGEFRDWLPSAGIILAFAFIGFIFDLSNFMGLLIGGVYAVWFTITGVKNLIRSFFSSYGFYGPSILMSLCRIVLAGTLIFFVFFWVNFPINEAFAVDSFAADTCRWAGGFAIASAVALIVEAVIWIKHLDY